MTEELIAEARAAIAAGGMDSWAEDADLITRLVDALEATAHPSGSEWEYQWGEPGETFEGFDPYATYEAAHASMREGSDYESHRVMRRRKAGPWEPVGGESA